ncbi:hypothetical protein KA005_53170, partial [bacterium]|nr:hypothetical protein [bacterium]
KIGDKFIEIMEIIYAIILACGIVKIVEIFQKNITIELTSSLLISVLVLVRFFFAPSKNIKIIGMKGVGWKWLIMPFDVPVLIAHSFIYYCMCLNIQEIEKFYSIFFILLFVNSVWLFSIWFRLKNEHITYIKIWAVSNLIFCGLYLSTYEIGLKFWPTWFILALLNSLIDLGITYSDYFQDCPVKMETAPQPPN